MTKKDMPYKGTVRMVTEEDIKNDPRLIAASVNVGQMYDFSNLEDIPEDAAQKNAEALNEAKDSEVKE